MRRTLKGADQDEGDGVEDSLHVTTSAAIPVEYIVLEAGLPEM